jgi:hypothetical protein
MCLSLALIHQNNGTKYLLPDMVFWNEFDSEPLDIVELTWSIIHKDLFVVQSFFQPHP